MEGTIMSLRINQNIDALNSYRNLSVTQGQMSKSLEKLSSGFRINRAADDAAGLAISEGLRSQVGGLKVAVRNAQDGVSVAQTADGALTEVHSMLQRMNDLSVQYASGTQSTESKAALQSEFDALTTEIGRIQTNTKFNGVSLFAGSAMTFQVGYASSDTIDIAATALANFSTGAAVAAVDITDSDTLQAAITEVSAQRAELGAVQNRFEHTINNVNVAVENLTASESRIRDTDMAQEMVNFTRSNILSQAGTAMLAQANQAPQSVLQLLRG
jgi:flagellin